MPTTIRAAVAQAIIAVAGAIVLWLLLPVPVVSVIAILFSFVVVDLITNSRAGAGARTVWSFVRLFGQIAVAVVIFATGRLLIGELIGLHPIDTYNKLPVAGGLYGTFWGARASHMILWEIMFAMGWGLASFTAMRRKGMARLAVITLFGASFLFISAERARPQTVAAAQATFPSDGQVAERIKDSGSILQGLFSETVRCGGDKMDQLPDEKEVVLYIPPGSCWTRVQHRSARATGFYVKSFGAVEVALHYEGGTDTWMDGPTVYHPPIFPGLPMGGAFRNSGTEPVKVTITQW